MDRIDELAQQITAKMATWQEVSTKASAPHEAKYQALQGDLRALAAEKVAKEAQLQEAVIAGDYAIIGPCEAFIKTYQHKAAKLELSLAEAETAKYQAVAAANSALIQEANPLFVELENEFVMVEKVYHATRARFLGVAQSYGTISQQAQMASMKVTDLRKFLNQAVQNLTGQPATTQQLAHTVVNGYGPRPA